MIETYVSEFKDAVETLTNRDLITEEYNSTVSKIDNILTIAEEEALINNARDNAISEAEAYMNERKNNYTKATWELIVDEYNSFVSKIYSLNSVTLINNELQQFKNFVDDQPIKSNGCSGSIVTSSTIVTISSIFAAILLTIRKKER